MNKIASIRVRLTAEEANRLRTVSSGNVSRYVRRAVLDVQANGPSLHDNLVAIKGEISAIGNNLNQIARRINSGESAMPQSIMQALASLMDTRENIQDVLRRVT